MMEKECLKCGKSFTPQSNRAKFCCSKCRNAYHYVVKEPETNNCAQCGSKFTAKRGTRFCSHSCNVKYHNSLNKLKLEPRNCKICDTSFQPKLTKQMFCSVKCKSIHQNARGRAINKVKCACCDNIIFQYEGGRKKTCSKECADQYKKEYNQKLKKKLWKKEKAKKKEYTKTCVHCKEKFKTTRKNKKYCSSECSDLKASKKPLITKECPQCGKHFETTSKVKKFCTRACGKKYDNNKWNAKVLLKNREAKKAKLLKNSKPTHDKIVDTTEIPLFVAAPEPKETPKDTLRRKIREREQRRASNDACKLKAMQDEWLKTNKVQEFHAPKTRYEPYSGKEEPTNIYTGTYSSRERYLLEDCGNKDYGDIPIIT